MKYRKKRKSGDDPYQRVTITVPGSILARVASARARGHTVNISQIASQAILEAVEGIEQREELKAGALAKLTDEEREALGLGLEEAS